MKKALVFYLYGNRNAGDMAICLGAIDLLKRQQYEITMVSRFSEAEDEYQKSKEYLAEYYSDVKVYPGPFSFERNFSTAKKLAAYAGSMLKVSGIIPDSQTKQLIREADVVFFNGGNLLRGACTADYLRLIALFYPIKIAHDMGKPVYCLPQSTAKISDRGEKMLHKYLKCFDTVYIREKISFEELKKRFPDVHFMRTTDLAFLCEDTDTAARKYSELGIKSIERTAAIVVRNTGIGDIGELDAQKQQRMKDKLIALVKAHSDYHYLIVVQTEKDRYFSQQLLSGMQKTTDAELIENHDPLVLREIYKHVDVLITMRLHAGILALSALTPVIGMFSEDWGLKNPGIMGDYEMPYLIIENDEEDIPAMQVGASKSAISQRIQKYTEIMNNIPGGGVQRYKQERQVIVFALYTANCHAAASNMEVAA